MNLQDYLARSTRLHPTRSAVEEVSGASISYSELSALSDSLRDRLVALGVKPGDRVGMYLRKTIDGIATIFGILKAGAAYVPVDPTAPASRNAYIMNDCSVRVAIVERLFEEKLRSELGVLGAVPPLLVIEEAGGGKGLAAALEAANRREPAQATTTRNVSVEQLAYILYTSGSTGKPKGVMLSQENATSFVEWCAEQFAPTEQDRFSSHAPFHFDLSILDIYTPIRSGAALVLIPEELGKEPVGLARAIAEQRISVWYSAPSILSLMAQFGKLETYDYSPLRLILFAGEVFPIVHLRSLCRQLPKPRYVNLYGPTETNVCTSYEVVLPVPDSRTDPYPIGPVCSQLFALIIHPDGSEVKQGEEGELCIAGPNVLLGYWNLPDNTERAFIESNQKRWYRTGDIVVDPGDGCYRFVGRRDRMVKKRGFRVELGEIETCLYGHPKVKEAAVVATADHEAGVVIHAHLSIKDADRMSLIELKQFCSGRLPVYMIPDKFQFHPALPKTSTDKVDYQKLKQLSA